MDLEVSLGFHTGYWLLDLITDVHNGGNARLGCEPCVVKRMAVVLRWSNDTVCCLSFFLSWISILKASGRICVTVTLKALQCCLKLKPAPQGAWGPCLGQISFG